MQSTMTNNNVIFKMVEISTHIYTHNKWANLHTYFLHVFAHVHPGMQKYKHRDRYIQIHEKHFIQVSFFYNFCFTNFICYLQTEINISF